MEALQQEFKDSECPNHGAFKAARLMLGNRPLRWSSCPECSRIQAEKDSEARVIAEALRAKQIIEWKMKQAGIPLRFRGRSFDSFVADTKPKNDALQAMREFAETFRERAEEGATYVLSGKPGTGKSHLAIAACQTVIQQDYSALYINALDVIRLVRSTWRRDSDKSERVIMDDLSDVGLLVIDEVGMQYGTEGEQVILFDIINRRYQDQQPMILLTNQGKDGFRQYLGDRAFDRLREAGRWLAFDWDSYRGRAVE